MANEIYATDFESDSDNSAVASNASKAGEFFKSKGFTDALRLVLKTMQEQSGSTLDELGHEKYKFQRSSKVPTDTLMLEGRGPPAKRCGLVKSMFRPSDDATTFPFLIPANCMAAVELERITKIIDRFSLGEDLKHACLALSGNIKTALKQHGIRNGVMAYEVDGFGNMYFMDDANTPSLLGLPLTGYCDSTDAVYQQTRKHILSQETNPYYFKGAKFKGIGGPHIGLGIL